MNETNESASAQYETREAEAPKPVKQQLSALRKQAADAEWTFDVGYTTALDLEIEQIAGLVPPENWQAEASAQNALAVAMMDEAPLELDGCEANAAAFNWADNGCVTPVKDQGACGSCWAFGTHGAFEGSYAVLNNHALVDTSEQQTLDCSGAGSCNGGWWAFQYLIDHGTAAESSYPYAGSDGACPNVDGTYWASTWGYVDPNAEIPSVEALKEALCSYGPIAIAVAVTPAFQAYTSGVFNENSPENINHAITLVGWDDDKKAWRIKNSWSTGWGEGGYMWIEYGSNQVGYGAAWVQANAAAPACDDAPSELAQTQFMFVDQKQYSTNANIESVTFTLSRDMFVHVVGESSATLASGSGPTTVTTGLYTEESPSIMWTASYRRATIPGTNHTVSLHTSFAMRLGAGVHTMYWKLWIDDGSAIQLDSGTLTALAVPCSMGGQVSVSAGLQAGAVGEPQVLSGPGHITIANPSDPGLAVTVDHASSSG